MTSRNNNGVGSTVGGTLPRLQDVTDLGSDSPNGVPGRADNSRKRVRGPTYMPKIWIRSEEDRIDVEFNEHGQPVDEETTTDLSHFMGSMARSGKYCPVDTPWKHVENEKKIKMLDMLKARFDLPPGSDDWLLKSFAKKVRNWRARIKEECYDPSLSLQEQLARKPKRVRDDQWKNLVTEWNKEEHKIVSEQNRANREKKKMMQVTGKKSYARVRQELKKSASGREPSRMELFVACFSKDGNTKTLEAAKAIEEMQELNSQLPEGSTDEPGPNDIFSKVMGKDKHGGARMFGLGVRASDVWGVVPSRSASYRENMQWKTTYERVSSEVAALKAMFLEMHGSSQNVPSQNDSSQNALDDSSVPVTSTHHPVATETRPLRVGATVYLKSIINPAETVAKGRLKSLDPKELVFGEEIGPNWCEVNIQVVVKRGERLVRPHDFLVTIEDAVGASVAWPCPFTVVMPEDDA